MADPDPFAGFFEPFPPSPPPESPGQLEEGSGPLRSGGIELWAHNDPENHTMLASGEPMPAAFLSPPASPPAPTGSPTALSLNERLRILQLGKEWQAAPGRRLIQLINVADAGELCFVLSRSTSAVRERFYGLASRLAAQTPASQGLDEVQMLWAGLIAQSSSQPRGRIDFEQLERASDQDLSTVLDLLESDECQLLWRSPSGPEVERARLKAVLLYQGLLFERQADTP